MIYGIVGMPGAGKTMLMTHIALTSRYDWILSNYVIRPDEAFTSRRTIRIHYWKTPEDLEKASLMAYKQKRSLVILVDEANIFFASRLFNKLPPRMLWLWSQNRKLRIDIYYTSQSLLRVDKALREITNYVIKPRLFKIPAWDVFICRADYFIPYDLTTDGITLKTQIDPYYSQWYLIRSATINSYNTEELIDLPDWVVDKIKSGEKSANDLAPDPSLKPSQV